MKSFYDFNRNNPEERMEQYQLFPEMALFHIALREEMGEEEYLEFYQAEKEAAKRMAPIFHHSNRVWATA
ncbi:hypothetical protein DXT99_19520 [Pontibacter diazotrophicus]|uniref:Uncharacterized protein n=1 Tax=Pontibacter diazotrophicus TaxID=1400979 RepID=A0A3D8L7K3_9BACT|nr:hypothetical protein [Pontibacter diazotrophicus]RDV13385.1 hypothetical protein DXT99_19520 [Pontibacter diazotrophicus]